MPPPPAPALHGTSAPRAPAHTPTCTVKPHFGIHLGVGQNFTPTSGEHDTGPIFAAHRVQGSPTMGASTRGQCPTPSLAPQPSKTWIQFAYSHWFDCASRPIPTQKCEFRQTFPERGCRAANSFAHDAVRKREPRRTAGQPHCSVRPPPPPQPTRRTRRRSAAPPNAPCSRTAGRRDIRPSRPARGPAVRTAGVGYSPRCLRRQPPPFTGPARPAPLRTPQHAL